MPTALAELRTPAYAMELSVIKANAARMLAGDLAWTSARSISWFSGMLANRKWPPGLASRTAVATKLRVGTAAEEQSWFRL